MEFLRRCRLDEIEDRLIDRPVRPVKPHPAAVIQEITAKAKPEAEQELV